MAETLDQAMTRKKLSNAALARLVSNSWKPTATRSISRIRKGYAASPHLADRIAECVNAYAPKGRPELRGGTVRPFDLVSQRNRMVIRHREPFRSRERAPQAGSTTGGGDDGGRLGGDRAV